MMSGVWESLFREETKQEWSIGVNVANLTNLIMEIPCTILALLSAAIIVVWEFILTQVKSLFKMVFSQDCLISLQWGSEYQTSLSGKSGIQMVEKRSYAKWSSFQMPFENWTARLFEYRANGCHLVFLCTGAVFEWSF